MNGPTPVAIADLAARSAARGAADAKQLVTHPEGAALAGALAVALADLARSASGADTLRP